jgi:hypothetical protein
MFNSFSKKPFVFNGIPPNQFSSNKRSIEAYGYPGCELMWDSQFGTDTVTNGATVTYWNDVVQGRRLVADSTPTYALNDASFNNYPSLQCPNANTVFRISNSGDDIVVVAPFTIVFVVRKIADNTGSNLILSRPSGTTNAIQIRGVQMLNTTLVTAPSVNDTAGHIIIVTNTNLYVDGVSRATATSFSPAVSYTHFGFNSGNAANCMSAFAMVAFYRQNYGAETITLSNNINAKYAVHL